MDKFGHKNKIGDFKYIDIKDLVNNIKDNTISEIDAKKTFKYIKQNKNFRKLIPGQKELLNLFNDLSDIILTDKTLMSSKDENEKLKDENEKLKEANEKLKEEKEKLKEENKKLKEEKENENENVNENDETLMPSNEDDETMRQNEIKELNNYLDEIIDKSKSFED